MKIRRLGLDDYCHLEEMVSIKRSEKFLKSFMDDDEHKNQENSKEYKTKWLSGMQKWYLSESNTHYLYGAFEDGEMMSCMTWRTDLPGQWSDGWVVGNLKSRTGKSFMNNGIIKLWEKMFEICDGLGLKRWHMVIPESNSNRYQAVADRYFKDIDSGDDYEWSIIVPANTQPSEDWVWGTMGRSFLNKEIRVRTGTKK
jgi:hypothetical protein